MGKKKKNPYRKVDSIHELQFAVVQCRRRDGRFKEAGFEKRSEGG